MEYYFKLYVAGISGKNGLAIKNLKILEKNLINDKLELDIIDILKQPNLAIQNNILATPTLVKTSPAPALRIRGDLSDLEKVKLYLNIK
ncbi:MAG: circadian clock KaiB family protein [Spirochaetota bacterium]|nr:circadian clock KaiB family protein [Spirochaetota bacterium]